MKKKLVLYYDSSMARRKMMEMAARSFESFALFSYPDEVSYYDHLESDQPDLVISEKANLNLSDQLKPGHWLLERDWQLPLSPLELCEKINNYFKN